MMKVCKKLLIKEKEIYVVSAATGEHLYSRNGTSHYKTSSRVFQQVSEYAFFVVIYDCK